MPSRLHRHDESGHVHFTTFCCFRRLQFFRHEVVRNAFVGTMKVVRAKLSICWIGYVVMPEHVHILVLPQARGSDRFIPISTLLHDLKGLSGKSCKEALRSVWREKQSLGTRPLDAWAVGAESKRFWKPRGHDFNVTTEAKVIEKMDYMHRNPIRRELVDRPEDWRWSSFRFHERGDDSLIGMDWDGGFPIVG